MNEEKKSRGRKWLLVLIAGLAVAIVYFFWPEEKGRAFRRAVLDGDLSKVKRLAAQSPELVNATNSLPPKIASRPVSRSQPLSGMDRLAVELFEFFTSTRIKNSGTSKPPPRFESIEDAGLPPLQIAMAQRKPEMILALLDMDADVNAVSLHGMTALHYAALENHGPEITRLLLANGAVADASNSQSLTPLYFSILRENEGNTRVLLEAGANPNAVSRDGGNSLHLAANRNGARIIPLLLKHGANPAHTNRLGQTALDVARIRNMTNAIRLLEAP